MNFKTFLDVIYVYDGLLFDVNVDTYWLVTECGGKNHKTITTSTYLKNVIMNDVVTPEERYNQLSLDYFMLRLRSGV